MRKLCGVAGKVDTVDIRPTTAFFNFLLTLIFQKIAISVDNNLLSKLFLDFLLPVYFACKGI